MTHPADGWVRIADCADLDRQPLGARVANVDLVVVRADDGVRVLYGRCTHRNAHLAEGFVANNALVCARHGWDYDCASGKSRCDPTEALPLFACAVREGGVWVELAAVQGWRAAAPMDFYEDELDP